MFFYKFNFKYTVPRDLSARYIQDKIHHMHLPCIPTKQSSQNTAEQSLFLVIRWHEQSVPVLGIVWEQIAKQLLVLEHRFRFFVIDLHGYFYFLHLSYNLFQWKVIKCIVFQIKVCTSEHPSARETKSLQNILFTLIPMQKLENGKILDSKFLALLDEKKH